MNDTSEAVQNVYRTLLMRRSGSERLRMGCTISTPPFGTGQPPGVLPQRQ
jgi:hypothetical protein